MQPLATLAKWFDRNTSLTAVAAGLLCLVFHGHAAPLNPCDLTGDGVVDTNDVNLAVSMLLGNTSCTASITGQGVCTVATLQRVINAAQTGTCLSTPSSHVISLRWAASSSSGISGYNVYRSTTSGGPYTRITASPVPNLTYDDSSIQPGQTYFYVMTAVDTSRNESDYSAQTVATVPNP